jgi:hypothetical protein
VLYNVLFGVRSQHQMRLCRLAEDPGMRVGNVTETWNEWGAGSGALSMRHEERLTTQGRIHSAGYKTFGSGAAEQS